MTHEVLLRNAELVHQREELLLSQYEPGLLVMLNAYVVAKALQTSVVIRLDDGSFKRAAGHRVQSLHVKIPFNLEVLPDS